MGLFRRAAPPPPRAQVARASLTAAASSASSERGKTRRLHQDWQTRALDYYNTIGECWYPGPVLRAHPLQRPLLPRDPGRARRRQRDRGRPARRPVRPHPRPGRRPLRPDRQLRPPAVPDRRRLPRRQRGQGERGRGVGVPVAARAARPAGRTGGREAAVPAAALARSHPRGFGRGTGRRLRADGPTTSGYGGCTDGTPPTANGPTVQSERSSTSTSCSRC